MPVMRFSMPKIKVPALTELRSHPAHNQYTRVLLTNTEANTTTKAQGTTVTTIHTK
jgi:hypothetical protein